MACSSVRCTSCTRAVEAAGTLMWMSAAAPTAPPSRPVSATVVRPPALAASNAASTLADPPLVEMPSRTSPGRPERLDLAREHPVEVVVVGHRRQDRRVRRQRDRGQRARSRSKRPTSSAAKCWASAALPPLPQARISPAGRGAPPPSPRPPRPPDRPPRRSPWRRAASASVRATKSAWELDLNPGLPAGGGLSPWSPGTALP